MIVRVASELSAVKIGTSDLKGKELVSWSDNVNFAAYDIILQAGSVTLLTSCFGGDCNHVYYCCYGEAIADVSNTTITLSKGTSLSLGGMIEAKMNAKVNTRLMMVVVKEDVPRSESLVQKLDVITGSERDIDWHHGTSRRFILESDGFNLTLTSTICSPRHISPMAYLNNYELAFYLRGDVTYTWNNGENSHQFKQEKVEDGDGCVFLMNNNDSHEVHTRDKECECLCVFYPALKGTETHDFKSGKPSIY